MSVPKKTAISGVAGGLAGSTVGVLLHPIDTIKTMMQVGKHANKGFFECGVQAVRQNGVLGGLYAGCGASAFGSFFSSALYFGTYETMKTYWNAVLPCHMAGLTASLAAVTGNAVSSLIFVPKEVLKQRCQVGQAAAGQSALSLVKTIVREEGVGAMYSGYFATLLRNAPGAMLKFGIYEQMKVFIKHTLKREVSPKEHFAAGMTAGCFSSAITTPLDVVKTRLMTGSVRPSFPLVAMVEIAQKEGVAALWSGFMPRLVWSATFFAVGMSAYELALTTVLQVTEGAPDNLQKGGRALGKLDPRKIPDLIQRVHTPDVERHILQTR